MKIGLRKKVLLLIIPLLLFLFNIDVKALDLKVTDFKLLNKNGSIEVSDPILNNNKVTSNIIFNEVDDYVTFEFDLINQENKKYTIVGISDNNENENILFEYDYSNDEIAKNEKSNVKIKISYKNLLKNVEEVKLDNVKVTITLITDDGEKEDIVIPITGDSIHLNIIALIISIVVFIYCLSKLHINNKVRISLIVMMVLLIPSIIFAQEKVEVGIEFNSIYVKGKFDYFNVTIDKDSGEEPITLSKKYGSTLEELTAPEKVGYTFVKWVDENNNEVNVDTIVKTNYVIKAIYEANTNTPYKVLHYRENIDDDEYTLFETEDKSGTTDTNIVAQEKEYTGFTFETNNQNNIKTGNINGDGSLELKLYYKRNKYEVTYSFTNNPLPNGVSTLPTDKEYKYEETVTVEDEATAPGYEFNGWMMDNNVVQTFKMPANNVNLKGTFNAINSNYKVEHYYENINDTNYSLFKTDNLEGTTDTLAVADIRNDEGIVIDENNENNIPSGIINGNGTLVLKLYYKRNVHNVTYRYTNDTLPTGTPNIPEVKSYKYGANVTIENNPTLTGYTFSGWKKDNQTASNFEMPNNDVTITGTWSANTDTPYKVEHYYENINDTNYSLFKTDELEGTTDTTVDAVQRSDQGFTFETNNQNNILSGNVDRNGTLVLKLYYTRNKYEVTYSYIGDIIPDDATVLPILRKYKYDETVTVANNATAQGYVFSGWSRTGTFKMPAEDVTITGSFTAGTSAYTIEHYGQDVNGDYVLLASETEHKTGTTNSNVTGTHKDIENHTYNDLNHIVYSYNPNHPDEVSRGKINSQGTLTLKFYYYRNKYDLHIMNETNVTGASSGSYYYGTQLTLVANARDEDDEPFTKWSDGVTDSLTRTISITKDTNIGPYYHIYTVTLINKDPRTTVTTTTELEKVDPGSSIVLPELTKEECVYPKDATHTTPEERECTFIAEFMGWYTDEEHTNKVESPYFPSGDVTLYAKWNAVYYHYRLSGIREYSGTPGDYDDSGIILYNIDNRNRDFDINFDIVEYGKSAFPQSTIMNGKFEKQSLNYPGFVIRFNTNSWDKIEFTSRWGTKTVDQYATGTNIWLEPATATEPIHVNITRRDGVVKITYSTNQTGTSIPAGGKTLTMFDQNSSNSPVLSDNTPTTVTFGATIDEQGIPMRFFKGKLANMEVKLTSELYN
jgi:uncharacterized repeat protein (TIGR02543 family)